MTDDREFWPDPWLDYDEDRQRSGNKPVDILLREVITTVESLVPCDYIDHIQGTNAEEWRCPECHEVYTSAGFKPYCGCKLTRPDLATKAIAEIKAFLDDDLAELLNRAYTLDKGTCTAHHTDAVSVRKTRSKLFNEAAVHFLGSRTRRWSQAVL